MNKKPLIELAFKAVRIAKRNFEEDVSNISVSFLILPPRPDLEATDSDIYSPPVQGVLYWAGVFLPFESAHELGRLAAMVTAESIRLIVPYVDWTPALEECSDKDLRATFEPWDADFASKVRDAFLVGQVKSRKNFEASVALAEYINAVVMADELIARTDARA